MLERNYSFFHLCMLFCRYVMFQNSILSKPKWGAQAVVRGARPPVATALNEAHPPMKVMLACHKSLLLTFWYIAGEKSKVAQKFKSEQAYLHPI